MCTVCAVWHRYWHVLKKATQEAKQALGEKPARSPRNPDEYIIEYPEFLEAHRSKLMAVCNRATHSALPTPCTFPRYTADLVAHRVWHRCAR